MWLLDEEPRAPTVPAMPKTPSHTRPTPVTGFAPLAVNTVHAGDSLQLIHRLEADSVALSFWSPPYFVGKEYERDLDFQGWQDLIRGVIEGHFAALKPGGFMVINIADILAFADEAMPRIQESTPSMRKVAITREQVLAAKVEHPDYNRNQLAELLGCSEQTIQRRVDGNNIRGGKQSVQTKVLLVGGLLQEWAEAAGFYLYDRRIWVKDPAWANSQWHSLSYRAVDEFEHLFIFWKPGITEVKRDRLRREEWAEWGSRAVWNIRSVRANDVHEAQFPPMLAERVIRLLSDPGDIVLDPFLGSGTTALVAQQQGRRWVGFERDTAYVELSRERLTMLEDQGSDESEVA